MSSNLLSIFHTKVFPVSSTGGNPCPVVFEGDNLSDEEMRKVAESFMEETVFILKPSLHEADVKLRYFVPNHEMEMCVHATIASITVLVKEKGYSSSPIHLETPLGIVKAYFQQNEDMEIDILVEQFPPEYIVNNPLKKEIAKALNILESDIERKWPVQSVSTSRAKLVVPLKSIDTLNKLQPNFDYLWEVCDVYRTTGFYPFAINEEQLNTVSARQFPNRAGFKEDPATGAMLNIRFYL
ncbi:PhzF family phenazine biosynthesis protein [Shouchella oshimensis]|uniref:PhzF family phenazine biosynthesis protein n=1 Tax=Shouchella oshimensis TaxID=290588 RepID=UPI0006EC0021|nr:PhzF family phenazine biosynthesis isomerase [Shouchella oshimensis]